MLSFSLRSTDSALVAVALAITSSCAGGCGSSGGGGAGDMDAGTTTMDVDAGLPVPLSKPALPAANAYPEGHALYQGQLRFLWDTWGVEADSNWPPPAFLVSLQTSEPAVFGNQFANFGFVHDPNDDLPVGLKRGISDPTKVSETCALCHVAELEDGRVWLGAPNAKLDIARFRVEVNRRWVAAGHDPLFPVTREAKELSMGPGRVSSEDPDAPYAVPASFPPYYNFQRRTSFTYPGSMSDLRSIIFVTIFDTGAGFPNDREAHVPWPGDARVQQMVDFLGDLVGPPGPAQDTTLVARGRTVFENAGCTSCHHPEAPEMDTIIPVDTAESGRDRRPGDDAAFPRGTIHTDPGVYELVAAAQPGGSGGGGGGGGGGVDAGPGVIDVADAGPGAGPDDRVADRFTFILRKRLRFMLSNGYRALGLKATWSTAPFLHNGSVPTLEDLLRPASERPSRFMLGNFEFDTTMPGNSNRGHEFGTDLPEADRTALVAYLRSL